MNINDALKVLSDNSGSFIYPVLVPSLKTILNFRAMTLGQQKTLAKVAMDNPDNFSIATIGIMKQLVVEPDKFDITKLTELDRVYILSHIYEKNVSTLPIVKFKCESSDCNTEYDISFSPISVCEKINTCNFQTFKPVLIHPFENLKVDVEIGLPTLDRLVMIMNSVNNLNKQLKAPDLKEDELAQIESLRTAVLDSKYLSFVREMFINGEKVDMDFGNMEAIAKFSEKIPAIIIDQIKKEIDKAYGNSADYLTAEFTCMKCKTVQKKAWSIDDFFHF